jgi:hypothetical protein
LGGNFYFYLNGKYPLSLEIRVFPENVHPWILDGLFKYNVHLPNRVLCGCQEDLQFHSTFQNYSRHLVVIGQSYFLFSRSIASDKSEKYNVGACSCTTPGLKFHYGHHSNSCRYPKWSIVMGTWLSTIRQLVFGIRSEMMSWARHCVLFLSWFFWNGEMWYLVVCDGRYQHSGQILPTHPSPTRFEVHIMGCFVLIQSY